MEIVSSYERCASETKMNYLVYYTLCINKQHKICFMISIFMNINPLKKSLEVQLGKSNVTSWLPHLGLVSP